MSDREIIPARNLTPQELQRLLMKLTATEYGQNNDIAARVAMHPLIKERERWERLAWYNKHFWGLDLTKNLLFQQVIRSIDIEGQLIAIHGGNPDKAGAFDPLSRLLIWDGGRGKTGGSATGPAGTGGPDVVEETSLNEENLKRMRVKAAEEKADRERRMAAELVQLREENANYRERLRSGNLDLGEDAEGDGEETPDADITEAPKRRNGNGRNGKNGRR